MVHWNKSLSAILRVRSGVRQGEELSPYLFNVYAVPLLIILLQRREDVTLSKHGLCDVGYADDLLLLSASLWISIVIGMCINKQGSVFEI